MLKPLQGKGWNRLKSNSIKTLWKNKGTATIFKDNLKGENTVFEKFDRVYK